MQIVIDIPEDDYYDILQYAELKVNTEFENLMIATIKNGTPLPKGHGRILDEKDILDTENNDGGWYDLVDMSEYIVGVKSIIEADKAERSDKE